MFNKIFPLAVSFLIFVFLFKALHLHQQQIPSPLINKPIPKIQLPALFDDKLHQELTNKDFLGHITLLNVWASWCETCAEENAFLLTLVKNNKIKIYGFDYKDNTKAAKKWLSWYGNPYEIIGLDQNGLSALDWGIYGTPETFLIDKHGIIRFKYIGPLTQEVWEEKIKSIISKLEQEV